MKEVAVFVGAKGHVASREEEREPCIGLETGAVILGGVVERKHGERLNLPRRGAIEKLGAVEAEFDGLLDDARIFALADFLGLAGGDFALDGDLRVADLGLDAANHRHALGSRDGEGNRDVVGVEVVVEGRAADAAQVLKPVHLVVVLHLRTENDLRQERGGVVDCILGERLVLIEVVPLVHVVAAILLVLLAGDVGVFGVLGDGEEAVGYERHAGDDILFVARIAVEGGGPAVVGTLKAHELAERALEFAHAAGIAEGEVEVRERHEGHD